MMIVDAIFGGFVSKIINDYGDIKKEKVKRALDDKNNRSFDTKIYRVIENALKAATHNKYSNQDKLYEAILCLFNEFKNSRGNNETAIKAALKVLDSSNGDYECEEFVRKFYEGICQDEDLHKRISLILQEKGIEINQEGFQRLNERIEKDHAELSFKMDSLTEILTGDNINSEKKIVTQDIGFQNNKKEDYIKNWNSRLFLHQDNDENPITLADAFIMPDYTKQKSIKGMGFYESDKLDMVIEKFMNYKKTSTMLITGVPGIGKSTITSWIANRYKDDDRVIILRFRDWKRKELKEGLLNAICHKLCCENGDLENRIVVLDGFDEMKALDIRERLLNDFASDIKDFGNFKCIMTSRPAYVNSEHLQVVIILNEFDEKKIATFYRLIKKSSLTNIKNIKSNVVVLGIPVILYMAIMSNVDISENPTKPELYNRIFAEKGGIFDRFFDGEKQYSEGLQLMRKPDNIKSYLKFLRDVAFMMFEKNNLSLKITDCEIPKLVFDRENISILEFPIKHLFENIESNIEFIHKSIYDYFVSEYIFILMKDGIKSNNHIKDIAGVLGELLKGNILSSDIIEFLKYKIRTEELMGKFGIVNQAFQLMLQDGMTYYTNERCKNVIECEKRVFANMLEVLHIWDCPNLIFNTSIVKYLKFGGDALNLQGMNLSEMNLEEAELKNLNLEKTQMEGINLENINFVGKNLNGIIWRGANLINANLTDAILTDAILDNADLSEAKLSNAVLKNSSLVKADLIGADLQGVSFEGANLTEASLYGANLVDAKLDNTTLDKANINYSIWEEEKVYKILPKLKNTVFKYIVIEAANGTRKEICRQELFLRQRI